MKSKVMPNRVEDVVIELTGSWRAVGGQLEVEADVESPVTLS